MAESLTDDDDGPLARTARFATQRYRDWVFANEKREQLRALMAEFFIGVDALLMPVAMVPAIAHDHSEPFPDRVIRVNGSIRPYTDLMAWIALATLTHLPATVVPVGSHGVGPAGRHPDRRAVSRGPHHARRRTADRGTARRVRPAARRVN